MWAPSFPSDSATKVRIAKSTGTSFRCRVLVFILKGRSLCTANLIHVLSVMLLGEPACCRRYTATGSSISSSRSRCNPPQAGRRAGRSPCSMQPPTPCFDCCPSFSHYEQCTTTWTIIWRRLWMTWRESCARYDDIYIQSSRLQQYPTYTAEAAVRRTVSNGHPLRQDLHPLQPTRPQ